MKDIDVPQRMQKLPRDKRGYPVPYIVLIDRSGTPQFTINDTARVRFVLERCRCSICGLRLERAPTSFKHEFWFVGGSRAFLHRHGAFLDPPVHRECGEYALRVCPFLAAPRYNKRIDDAKLKDGDLPDGMALSRIEYMPPQLPERFGFGMTNGFAMNGPHIIPASWQYIEWWHGGEQVNAPDTADGPMEQERVRE